MGTDVLYLNQNKAYTCIERSQAYTTVHLIYVYLATIYTVCWLNKSCFKHYLDIATNIKETWVNFN